MEKIKKIIKLENSDINLKILLSNKTKDLGLFSYHIEDSETIDLSNDTGFTGDTGYTGYTGYTGDTGLTGDTGSTGE